MSPMISVLRLSWINPGPSTQLACQSFVEGPGLVQDSCSTVAVHKPLERAGGSYQHRHFSEGKP